VKRVGWGEGGARLLTALRDGRGDCLALLDPADAVSREQRDGMPGEPRVDLCFVDAPALLLVPRERACEDLLAQGALLRAAQMAGALDTALAMTTAHVSERVQFGRALAKFQVIQHQLALLAEEAAAVTCAAQSACAALDRGEAQLALAAAKLRANRAVQPATSMAHQLHGAIGCTREHTLHRFTQRLWCWRADFGNDAYWADHLGRLVTSEPAVDLWSRLTGVLPGAGE
jgi:acyl-CoA dehydrogenase